MSQRLSWGSLSRQVKKQFLGQWGFELRTLQWLLEKFMYAQVGQVAVGPWFSCWKYRTEPFTVEGKYRLCRRCLSLVFVLFRVYRVMSWRASHRGYSRLWHAHASQELSIYAQFSTHHFWNKRLVWKARSCVLNCGLDFSSISTIKKKTQKRKSFQVLKTCFKYSFHIVEKDAVIREVSQRWRRSPVLRRWHYQQLINLDSREASTVPKQGRIFGWQHARRCAAEPVISNNQNPQSSISYCRRPLRQLSIQEPSQVYLPLREPSRPRYNACIPDFMASGAVHVLVR